MRLRSGCIRAENGAFAAAVMASIGLARLAISPVLTPVTPALTGSGRKSTYGQIIALKAHIWPSNGQIAAKATSACPWPGQREAGERPPAGRGGRGWPFLACVGFLG